MTTKDSHGSTQTSRVEQTLERYASIKETCREELASLTHDLRRLRAVVHPLIAEIAATCEHLVIVYRSFSLALSYLNSASTAASGLRLQE